MKTYIRLSKHLSNIASGNYWNDKILKRVIKNPLLNESERLTVLWFSKGYPNLRHEMQEISIKLYINKA
jgi:hypothetical protein